MMYYETLILLDPQASPADIESVESQVKDLLSKNTGSLATFDKWGKYSLAYPVRKKDHGIYALARYEIAENHDALFKKLDTHFRVKLPDLVMRHVHVKLTPEEFKAEYIKPEPVDREGGDRGDRGGDRRRAQRATAAAPVREAAPAKKEEASAAEQAAELTTDQSAEG